MKNILIWSIIISSFTIYSQEKFETNREGSNYQFKVIKNLDVNEVQDQGRTSTCWSFSSLSFFESEILRLKKQNHIDVVKKFGKACSYPGTFMGSIHAMITSKNYKDALLKTIRAGGCNCSRANFVGAYFSALKGFENIPSSWIKKTRSAKNVLKYILN